MDYHEAANIFPLAEDDDLDALAEDIRQHGLQIPIETLGGKIIDGRRRWLACMIAGVEPDVLEVEPDDPVAYVLSLNLHRRHLNESQRTMVAARTKDYYAKLAKERQKASGGDRKSGKSVPENLPEAIKGDSRDQAGAAVGVSGKSVDHGTAVLERGSKALQEAVDTGRLPVSSAAQVTALPKAEQTRIAKAENPKAEARKALAPQKPKRTYADMMAAAFRELGDRVDSIVEQYGSLSQMFDSDEWKDCDCCYVIDMIHELKGLFERLNTEAQDYAKAKGIEL